MTPPPETPENPEIPETPPRAPRALVVHFVVDTAVVFLATIIAALLFGAEWWMVLVASIVIGAALASWTRRAEIKALAEDSGPTSPPR